MNISDSILKEVLSCLETENIKHLDELISQNSVYAFALKDCCYRGFVQGLDVKHNALQIPVFQSMEGFGITPSGLNFLKNS